MANYDERTESMVTWNSKSFCWDIVNFADICGLHTEECDINYPDEFRSVLDIDFVQSPIFKVGSKDDGTEGNWSLKLTKSEINSKNIDVRMELTTDTEENQQDILPVKGCFFKYRISVMDKHGEACLKRSNNVIIYLRSGDCWLEGDYINIDHLRSNATTLLLEGDTLRLRVDISVLCDLHHSNLDPLPKIQCVKKRKMTTSILSETDVLYSCQMTQAKNVLSSLWKTRVNSDAVVECDGSVFPVHKSILSSASSVFSAAFTHDMQEKATGRILVHDIDAATIELILRFIYCDTNLDEPQWRNVDCLTELINAAEKYQLPALKSACFSLILEEITLNNAAQVVTLVHLFEPEDHISDFVHQYVIRNISVLKQMESFKKKLREIPAAFAQLLLLI